MTTALAVEVQVEAGATEPLEILHAKQEERLARSRYAQAVDRERAALRIADKRTAVVDCPRCIPCSIGNQVLLCGQHTAQLHALRAATANRIRAQRALGDAQYALQRIRRGQR